MSRFLDRSSLRVTTVYLRRLEGQEDRSWRHVAEATTEIALVRFHGRNNEAWNKRGITPAERFDYLYSDDELREWVPRVEKLANDAREVHLLMNNCHEDKAVVGARQLHAMLP